MGRRKSSSSASSLDLFLDTICNAFGGIMFISILISVLVQLKGGNTANPVDTTTVSRAEAQELEERIETLDRERSQLISSVALLESTVYGEDQQEVLGLKKLLVESERRVEQSRRTQLELGKQLNSLESDIRERQEELEKLDNQLSNAQSALAEKSKAIDDSLDSREQKTALPKVRATNKRSLLCAMRYGKLYLVSDVDASSRDEYYSAHVTETKALGVVRIKPRKNAGWDVADNRELAKFGAKISGHPASTTFLSCAVWPDSFEKFAVFKEELLRLGYEYTLVPVDDVEELTITKGNSASVQ